jgi:uncharacterized membrane protein
MQYAIAYGTTALVFLAMDYVWLTNASRFLYRPQLGDLLSENPNLAVAALFYLVYVAGIVVFAISPAVAARSVWMAVGLGAFLGLVAYGTYDITNYATIRGWPAIVSIVDLIWGISVTAISALAGYGAVRYFADSALR